MTWHFLTRGASVTTVQERFAALLAEASSITSASRVDQVVIAQRYLRWCEQVELHLQTSFADPVLTRDLYTPRHWQIRAIDSTTRMAFGMIEGELRDQVRVLEALRDQIEHYSGMARPDDGESLVLLDTNVYLHGQPFENVRWQRHMKSKQVRLLMPLIIVDELDKHKDRYPSARSVLRALDSLFGGATSLAALPVRDGVTLQVLDEPAGHNRLGRADDEIVRQASYLSVVTESTVTLITRDRGMRIRALASGIDARMLPAELDRRKADDSTESDAQ
ncbi:PIN domain-containing protein [Microbacterium sp. A8/3-1]|uniref:PIN domain-containing protein n=1 Tax=Microbacterium sp. A8/3-1 TaxID=3160749 RepID=A0AAU7VWX8_9MICO